MSSKRGAFFAVAIFGILSGCGTYVPDMQNAFQSETDARVQINDLVNHSACEIVLSVQSILLDNAEANIVRRQNGLPEINLNDLNSWAAQVVLTLTVEEKGQSNPLVSLNAVYPTAVVNFARSSVNVPQTGSLSLAASVSSAATRKITVGYRLNLKDYLTPKNLQIAAGLYKSKVPVCSRPGGVFTDGDLKFKDTLYTAMLPANIKEAQVDYLQALGASQKATKKDVIGHQVTFIVMTGANVTPSIKLVEFAVNQGSLPFLGAQRTNTQDVLITLGPVEINGQLSASAQNTILSGQIETAFRNALGRVQ